MNWVLTKFSDFVWVALFWRKKKRASVVAPAPKSKMILSRKICFASLSSLGKAFVWEPHDCESCRRPMWGHGFVSRYFTEIAASLYLKRFRCPGCGTVATVRPEGYWPRVRSAIATIYAVLNFRVNSGLWPEGSARQRCGHWLRRFGRKVRMDFGPNADFAETLEFCFAKDLGFFT
jgi:hypothetical protein